MDRTAARSTSRRAAYHHVHMRPDAIPYLGFEWQGQFYRFFGAAVRPCHGRAEFYGCHGPRRPFSSSALRGVSGPPLFGRSDLVGGSGRRHGPGGPNHGPDATSHPPAVRLARPPDPSASDATNLLPNSRRGRRWVPRWTWWRGSLSSESLPTSSTTKSSACSAWHGAIRVGA